MTTVNNEVKAKLYDDVCAKVDDLSAHAILADWCEDNGLHDEADARRWLVAQGKRPYFSGNSTKCSWFNADTIGPGLQDEESDIPGWVFERLKGGKAVANHRTYDTSREAFDDILPPLQAWLKEGQPPLTGWPKEGQPAGKPRDGEKKGG
jgi:hypothetical protein